MEHRAPRHFESTLEDISLDHLHLHKRDLYMLPMKSKHLPEDEVAAHLQEAVELATLVEVIASQHRELNKQIRRLEREPTMMDDLQASILGKKRLGLVVDAALVAAELPKTRFRKLFPRTHRRLVQRLTWMLTPKKKKEQEADTLKKPDQPLRPSPLSTSDTTSVVAPASAFIQSPAIMGYSRCTLKDLLFKYRIFQHGN